MKITKKKKENTGSPIKLGMTSYCGFLIEDLRNYRKWKWQRKTLDSRFRGNDKKGAGMTLVLSFRTWCGIQEVFLLQNRKKGKKSGSPIKLGMTSYCGFPLSREWQRKDFEDDSGRTFEDEISVVIPHTLSVIPQILFGVYCLILSYEIFLSIIIILSVIFHITVKQLRIVNKSK